MKRLIAALAAAFLAVFASNAVLAAETVHKLAIHVDANDPAVMNLALNNAANVRQYYKDLGEGVEIEIVAYGPGLNMYTADSPVKDRISTMGMEDEHIRFSACGNTLAAFEKKKGGKVELLSEAKIVPSGVVRLMELQQDGYSYIRP